MKWMPIKKHTEYLKRLTAHYKTDGHKESERIFEKWIAERGIDLYSRRLPADLCHYLRTGAPGRRRECCERPPRIDHPMIFKNSKTNRVHFVYQPYWYDEVDVFEIKMFFATQGLSARISKSDSWHWPNDTYLVEVVHERK